MAFIVSKVVPVVDNTADIGGPYPSWSENAKTVSLVPEKMLWFRKNYLPNKEDWTKWDNSPIFAPKELFAKAPNAWIAVAELDILRDEGIAYGEKLKEGGLQVEVKIYKGAPHPIMAMDGMCHCMHIVRKLMDRCTNYRYQPDTIHRVCLKF